MTKTKLYTTGQAIEYIQARLPENERWTSPYRTIEYHRRVGNIRPEPMETSDPEQARQTYIYRQSELDHFIDNRRKPGNQFADVSAVVDRLGREPDTALAREIGLSVSAVRRARERLGIKGLGKGWRKGRPRGNEPK